MRRYLFARFGAPNAPKVLQRSTYPVAGTVSVSFSTSGFRFFSAGDSNKPKEPPTPSSGNKNQPTSSNRIPESFTHGKVDDLYSGLQDIFNSGEDESELMKTLITKWAVNVSNEMSDNFVYYFDALGYFTRGIDKYDCAYREINSKTSNYKYAIFFNYRATGNFMAVIRAKDKYFSHAVESQVSERRFVTNYRLVHSGKEENYYLCTLWDIPDPYSEEDKTVINTFFQRALAPPINVGSAFEKAHQNATSSIKNLPDYFKFSFESIKGALRPVPAKLFVLQPANTNASENFTDILPQQHVDKPTKDQYPTVFAGFSGIGKTVSALMLRPSLIRGDVPKGEEWPIVGIYVTGKTFMQDYPKPGTQDRDITADGLIADEIVLGTAIANLIAKHCRVNVPGATDLSKTVFYVILDEMGPYRDIAALLIGYLDNVKPAIRRKLQMLKFVFSDTENDCKFHFSIVGTGVTSPGPSGSLPKGYKLWQPQYEVGDLFQQKLTQLSDCEPSVSHVMFKAILTQPVLSSLLTNVRCEALMAESVNKCFPYKEDVSDLSPIVKVPYIRQEEAEKLASSNSTWLEDTVILGFINMNGWKDLTAEEKVFYAKWVISLSFTQPHGFHLLPYDVVETLVVKLGAIGDTFMYDSATSMLNPVPLVQGPSHSHGYHPTDTQRNSTGKNGVYLRTASFFSYEKYLSINSNDKGGHVKMRFEVPPASFIIAVNIVARITGSGSTLLPKVYEEIVTSMLHAALQTFTWYAAYDDGVKKFQPTISVPVRFLFPNAPSILQNEEIVLKTPTQLETDDNLDVVTKTKEWSERCMEDKWEPVKADQLSNGKFHNIVDETWKQVTERGVALVFAGDMTPLSDITLFSPHQCIGIELKNYTDGGLVKLSTLRKRCFQLGYNAMQMTTNVDKRNKSLALPPVLYPMLENATRLGGSHEKTAIAKASLTPSMYGPQLMRITFGTQEANTTASRIGRLFHMVLREKQLKNTVHPSPVDQATHQKIHHHHSLREFLILCSPKAHLLPTVKDGLVDARFVSQHVAQEVRDNAWREEQSIKNGPCLITTVTLSVVSMSVRCSPKAKQSLEGNNAKASMLKSHYVDRPEANKDNLYELLKSDSLCYTYRRQYTEWDNNNRKDIFTPFNDQNVQFFRTKGATVDMSPQEGSAAFNAGIKEGDIITVWDNQKINSQTLSKALSYESSGSQRIIPFKVLRNRRFVTNHFEVPWFEINEYLVSGWGVINKLDYPKPKVCIGFEFDDNLTVTSIEPYGAAAMAGVQVEDRVTKWKGTIVKTKADLVSYVKEAEVGRHVLLEVYRGDKRVQLLLRLLTNDERYKGTALNAIQEKHL